MYKINDSVVNTRNNRSGKIVSRKHNGFEMWYEVKYDEFKDSDWFTANNLSRIDVP